ncbi:MAG: hypothetical protein FI703_09385 [SAR202 cluster bacterium]|nr:hypothetical protein [SAR202 cluster bacterium]
MFNRSIGVSLGGYTRGISMGHETLEAGLKVIRRLKCKLFGHQPVYATFGMQSMNVLSCERCNARVR